MCTKGRSIGDHTKEIRALIGIIGMDLAHGLGEEGTDVTRETIFCKVYYSFTRPAIQRQLNKLRDKARHFQREELWEFWRVEEEAKLWKYKEEISLMCRSTCVTITT